MNMGFWYFICKHLLSAILLFVALIVNIIGIFKERAKKKYHKWFHLFTVILLITTLFLTVYDEIDKSNDEDTKHRRVVSAIDSTLLKINLANGKVQELQLKLNKQYYLQNKLDSSTKVLLNKSQENISKQTEVSNNIKRGLNPLFPMDILYSLEIPFSSSCISMVVDDLYKLKKANINLQTVLMSRDEEQWIIDNPDFLLPNSISQINDFSGAIGCITINSPRLFGNLNYDQIDGTVIALGTTPQLKDKFKKFSKALTVDFKKKILTIGISYSEQQLFSFNNISTNNLGFNDLPGKYFYLAIQDSSNFCNAILKFVIMKQLSGSQRTYTYDFKPADKTTSGRYLFYYHKITLNDSRPIKGDLSTLDYHKGWK